LAAQPDPRGPVPFILCADDYAIAPGVSRAIVRLIERGRLSATSCMTVSPHWPDHALWLAPCADQADIGLHFTLTDQVPLGPMPRLAPRGRFPSLPRLLALALTRRLDEAEIAAELDRQIERFESAFGRPPDFIDGHQHAHQLPIIREIVLRAMHERLQGAYLRICDEPLAAIMQRRVATMHALVISALGRGLRREATRLGIPANRRFAGVRTFHERRPYPALFRRFVAGAPQGLLVMCHAGQADAALAAADPVTDQRNDEYAYLQSTEFADDLAASGVTLGRFSQVCGPGTSYAAD